MCRAMSTLLTLIFIFISTENVATEAFSQIVDIAAPSDIVSNIFLVKIELYTIHIPI